MTTRWLLNENFPHPSVLRLRTEGWDIASVLPHEPAEWLIQLQRESQLKDGWFHVFDGDALRRRPFLSNISGGIG